MKKLIIVGTADTKGAELDYIRTLFVRSGNPVQLIDVGTRHPTIAVDITAQTVAGHHPDGADLLNSDDRGTAVGGMAIAFEHYMHQAGNDVAGAMGLGGGGGTSIVAAGFRQLPYGLPKMIVSTLASGDVAPYVGTSDIMMAPSVTDIAGLNRLSRQILNNAAQAVLGAVANPAPARRDAKPAIGLSMFGVTTPCVTKIAELLQQHVDPLIFHATGTGGRAMEKLVAERVLSGLIDITTTEIADMLFGGVLPSTPDRIDVVARTQVPYVGSLGATDMVNFWAPETVPPAYQERTLYFHNPNVTLMRTTAEECQQLGTWIGRKLNDCAGPVRMLIPEKGVSTLDIEGGEFWLPDADNALFDALEEAVNITANRQVMRLPLHINDPAFAAEAARIFQTLM